jgi:hypothetical protein
VDAALDCLRRAAADADLPAARDIQVEALVSLGGALMHTVRGRDEEAAALLHQALVVGAGLGRPSLLAHAHRELGTADLIVGRRQRAEAWFASADDLAARDDDECSAIPGWRAVNLADMGRHGQARALAPATRTEMPEVLIRAHTYRHLAGQAGALELARLAASRLENAELAALIENCGAGNKPDQRINEVPSVAVSASPGFGSARALIDTTP